MKKYNNIDDLFKEQASDFQIKPSDKVWQNIEAEFLKTNKTNTRNRIIWSLASLLLIISGIYTLTMFNHTTKHNNSNVTINSSIQNINTTTINNTKTTRKEISPIAKPKLSKKNTDNKNTESKINHLKNSGTNENTDNNILNNQIAVTTSNTDTKHNEKKYNDDFISIYSMSYLSQKNNNSIENIISPFEIDDFEKISIDEYILKRKKLHFYTGASASIAMTYYAVSADQATWSADLTYGLKIKQFYIESGIGFQKMKEEGIFQIDFKSNDSVGYYNEVVSFEVNPNNPNTITYKTQTTTVYDSIDHQLLKSPLYHYDYITIPIKFGYKFFQRDKFSVSAETGIIYSLLTKTYIPTVTYNDDESQLVRISNNTQQRVEHNFRLHVALRLNYNITKTISCSAQPEFASFINSIYKQPSNDHSRPYTMGIRFGILFDF